MRKTVLLIICLIILGCSSQETYTLDVFVWGDRPYLPDNGRFKASSDEEAYQKAVDLMNIWVGEKYINSYVNFTVRDKYDEPLEKRENCIPKIVKMQQERAFDEERKAYAGARFGMTKYEVLALPHFNGFVNHAYERVGNDDYLMDLLFGDDDRLYNIHFQTDFESFESAIRSIYNFEEVIEEAHGEPTNSASSVSRNEINRGLSRYPGGINLYFWRIGKKSISIGIKGNNNLSKYQMFADIVYYGVDEESANKHKKAINNSSALF